LKKNIKLILLLIVPFFYGCNSEKKEKMPEITIIAEISSQEGTPFIIDLPENTRILDITNDELFFTLTENKIYGVAPNVEQNKTFIIELSEQKGIAINVTNKPYGVIPEATRNYAFANGNIIKYEQFLSNGNFIPLAPIGDQLVHYPVTVSKYAHDLYANFRSTGDINVLDRFYINAIWLRDNCVYTQYGFCSWRTEPEYTPYKTGKDWPSAMAQGQAISVMISAYSLTKDHRYLKVAQDALAAFFYPSEVKGVKSSWDGYDWYEEYTSLEPVHVLNGFLFSMAGLFDAVELLGDESARIAFDNGIVALQNKLADYDVDFTSLYDQEPDQLRFASAKTKSLDGYHELHILQLAWIYKVTEEERFLTMFRKFLANDIGAFNSSKFKSVRSNKIESITTTHSVNSVTNGPVNLYDRNWTYGNYWSTHKNGTEIEFQLNEVDDSEGIECIMMSSILPIYFPQTFDVYAYIDSQWLLVFTQDEVANINYVDHVWKFEGSETTARTYCFGKSIKTSEKFKIVPVLADSNLIALKEINLHYNRVKIENELLNIYHNWHPAN